MSDKSKDQLEIERLQDELRRAYRAISGFYSKFRDNNLMTPVMLSYHSPTIGAARRYIKEGSLEGAAYFDGKSVDVLREAMGIDNIKDNVSDDDLTE